MIWHLAFAHDGFRNAWQQALHEAGMGPHLFPPTETLDLGRMSRTYDEEDDEPLILSWQEEPEVEVHSAPNGRLYLRARLNIKRHE
jgi:hypothetical protein